MTIAGNGPLSGVRVVDLTTVISGPVCTMLLADQGADVVKVEPPGGDIARRTAGNGEFTAMFVSSNRGKRSIALDLKQPAAVEAVKRLIAVADAKTGAFSVKKADEAEAQKTGPVSNPTSRKRSS